MCGLASVHTNTQTHPNTERAMTMTIELTPTQHATLAHAHNHTEGRLTWFPENITGGARQNVIDALAKRALIVCVGKDWFVAPQGYDALGVTRRAPVTLEQLEVVITNAEPSKGITSAEEVGPVQKPVPEPKEPRTRENSKQAQMIALLKRPEGATIAQMVEATGWQSHTVRGAMAGALKKRLGLVIDSIREGAGERIYRVS